MQQVRELIAQAAGSDSRILILGENGTGKELVAREVHRQSGRAEGPVRRAELRRHPREPDRERAVRPREGRLHQRAGPATGKVRGGRPRHALPRRDRRHVPGHAGEGAARAAGDALRADRRRGADRGGRARHRGHEQGHPRADPPGEVPRGPVLPHQRGAHRRCRRCASGSRTCPSWCAYFMEKFKRPSEKEPRTVSRGGA